MGTKNIETEINREKVYEFVKANPNTTNQHIADALGFTKSQTDYYVRPMVLSGILVKMLRQTSTGRKSIFNVGKKLFVRKMKTEDEVIDAKLAKEHEKLPPEVQGVARIVKLSDRNMQPPVRKNKKRSGRSSWVGSSMGMFDGY